MEKQRGIKTLAVLALIVAVLGLTVAFAVLSTSLTINGQATVKSGTWEIKFENLSEVDKSTDAVVNTAPTISENGTEISTYSITLTKPGDYVSYTFDVHNNGSIDAKIGTFSKDDPTCQSIIEQTSEETDADIVCKNLVYTLQYVNNSGETYSNEMVKKDDELIHSQKRTMKLTIGYDSNANAIPSNDVKIDIPTLSMIYVQK